MGNIVTTPILHFDDINGRPLVGGRLYSYEAGSSTPTPLYMDEDLTQAHQNPVVLDMRGECRAYYDPAVLYKLVLKDSDDNVVWEADHLSAGGSGGGTSNVLVSGTLNEIVVHQETIGAIKRFVVSLSSAITNAIGSLQTAISNMVSELNGKKDKQLPVDLEGATTKTVVRFTQNANGESSVEYGDIPLDNYELNVNKKTTVTGNEGSNTYYPTIKALVDYLDSRLQNLGGKKITNNGVPFTTDSQLPTTTPYYGQNINSNDYAYVQDTGIASRYTAIVTSSSVAWSLDYEIAIPVFTPEQQAAIDSGATATKIGNYDSHIANATIHVTSTEKYTWNHKQNALPATGTPSSTFAINVSGTANKANYLIRAYVDKSNQITKIWKKIATSKTFTSWDAGSICFLYNHSGYQNELGLDSIVSVTIHTGDAGSLSNARIYTYSYRSASETQLVRIGSTNQYEVWVKVPNTDTNMYATVLNSYGDWTINTDNSQTGQLTDDEFTAYKSSNPSVGTSYNYNVVKASKVGVGSTRLPIFANSDGILSPMNIDEYYCWANPTTQWTDIMELTVWYVQNQCNNEILGSVKRINLTSSHPSLCYLRVNLPNLQGAGRYRFTLEFDITNSDGQNLTEAYGVLILVPPTGYSGETFLAECAYDSSGRAQSSVMNQIHVPPQGSTYRHKLYVDGHTYRVVKTK